MTDISATPPLDVQAMLRQLRANYLAEMHERLGGIESDLLAIERTGRFGETFERCYRRVHSLKGSAGTYGLPILGKIAHQLEEHLDLFADDRARLTAELLNRCLAHIDLMRQAQQEAQQGAEHFNDIDEALHALRGRFLDNRFSVLIVEVSKVNIKLCREILKDYPAHVTVLDSGYQALELLLQQKYQLLITGLEVKVLNGLALVAAVRMSARGNQDIQSILLTSSKLPPLKRNVDPDFIVARDGHFTENLTRAVEGSIGTLQAK
jgi:CheY-like chemotaxis protein/HPt (histidine-containing phosphotransfer) domain-containing protein